MPLGYIILPQGHYSVVYEAPKRQAGVGLEGIKTVLGLDAPKRGRLQQQREKRND